MKSHITNVLEFQEIGLLLAGPGRHIVRVMGSLKVIPPPDLPASKEELVASIDRAPFERYYSADAPERPDDQLIHPDDPQVPALYVTREGKVVFLGRNLDEIT
jgi:hypothetical protein